MEVFKVSLSVLNPNLSFRFFLQFLWQWRFFSLFSVHCFHFVAYCVSNEIIVKLGFSRNHLCDVWSAVRSIWGLLHEDGCIHCTLVLMDWRQVLVPPIIPLSCCRLTDCCCCRRCHDRISHNIIRLQAVFVFSGPWIYYRLLLIELKGPFTVSVTCTLATCKYPVLNASNWF